MEQWEKNYYITAVAGANSGNSFVVMSKGILVLLLLNAGVTVISVLSLFHSFHHLYSGTQYLQQSYKVSDSFPFKWINKKWREGFYVTSMATAGSKWGIVMSRGASFSDQVCEVYILFGSRLKEKHESH